MLYLDKCKNQMWINFIIFRLAWNNLKNSIQYYHHKNLQILKIKFNILINNGNNLLRNLNLILKNQIHTFLGNFLYILQFLKTNEFYLDINNKKIHFSFYKFLIKIRELKQMVIL